MIDQPDTPEVHEAPGGVPDAQHQDAAIPAAWTDAQHELETRLHALSAAVDDGAAAWQATVQEQLLEPLAEVARRAAAAHAQLAEALLAGEPARSTDALWHRVRTYRSGTRERVVQALRVHLAERTPGAGLAEAATALCTTLSTFLDDLPKQITVPEPPSLLTPHPSDPLRHRFGKQRLRLQRQMEHRQWQVSNALRRLARRPRRPGALHGQTVPLRHLVAYHLGVRLPERMQPVHEGQQAALARYVKALEAVLTAWTHDLLALERDLDRPAAHRPSALPPAETEPQSVPDEVVARLREQVGALQAALEAASEAPDVPWLPPEVLSEAEAELEADLARGGTFLLDLSDRPVPATPVAFDPERTWAAWHTQVLNRFAVNRHLMTLREQLVHLEDALLQRVAVATLRPVFRTLGPLQERLRSEADEVEALFAQATTDEALVEALQTRQGRVLQTLQEAWQNLPGLVASDEALAEPGNEEWAKLQRIVSELPERVLVPGRADDEAADLHVAKPFRIDLRAAAADAMSVELTTSLRKVAEALRLRVVRVWGETEAVQHIVQYNLEAALEELGGTPAASDAHEEPRDPRAAALELATDGLRRAAETLESLAAELWAPWDAFQEAVHATMQSNWADLHRRVRAQASVEEQWVGFRTRLTRRVEQRWRQTRTGAQALWGRTSVWLRWGQRRAQQLIQKGQTAVGALDPSAEARLATIDAVTDVAKLQGRLPLIYRKLFSFEPVTEPSLFEGRADVLGRVRRHFQRWQEGLQAGVLILPAPSGSGRTSLLRILPQFLFAEADVRTLTFDRRPPDEAALAALIAETLGLEGDAGRPLTLDDLEAHLIDQPRPTPPRVCCIDNLEHLFLRAPGGLDMLERMLIFLSRTDTQVYWVATVGAVAWHFVEKTVGAASGFVTVSAVDALTRDDLEALILSRHRRTGLPLRFAPPSEHDSVIERQRQRIVTRLRRARTDEEEQALLRTTFFDRLHRHSGAQIMLALFYWLRATDFEAEPGVLTIRPLQPLDFSFIQVFDLPRAFTLKAFVLHRTLTLAEHNRIFRMTDDQSTFILESLLNLRLIEPAERTDTASGSGRLLPGARYRIRPLFLQPVLVALRARHIIY